MTNAKWWQMLTWSFEPEKMYQAVLINPEASLFKIHVSYRIYIVFVCDFISFTLMNLPVYQHILFQKPNFSCPQYSQNMYHLILLVVLLHAALKYHRHQDLLIERSFHSQFFLLFFFLPVNWRHESLLSMCCFNFDFFFTCYQSENWVVEKLSWCYQNSKK